MILNINFIWYYLKTRFILLNNLIINQTRLNKQNYLNGYDAIREKLDEHNALTVKHQPIESVKHKTKMTIGLK